MGRLWYGREEYFVVEDDLIAHLRVVTMNKLRRGEAFMLTVPTADGTGGRRSLWMSPAVPMSFTYSRRGPVPIRRELIEALMDAANSPDGLDVQDLMTGHTPS